MFSQKIEYSGGVFLTPLFSFVIFHLKGSYNRVCKNMYFVFGTHKREMSQMLF